MIRPASPLSKEIRECLNPVADDDDADCGICQARGLLKLLPACLGEMILRL